MWHEGRRADLVSLAAIVIVLAVVVGGLLFLRPVVSEVYYCHGEPLMQEDGTVPTPDPNCID